MRAFRLICVHLLLFAATLGTQALGQEQTAQPGPEHKLFQRMAGDWECVMEMGPEGQFPGTSKISVELNGLHMVQVYRGNLGEIKFEGRGVTSYCPVRKKYMGTWVDNINPSPILSQGTLSEDGKQLVEFSEGVDPSQGIVKMKFVTDFVSDDEMSVTMYQLADGQETQGFKLTYKRKGK